MFKKGMFFFEENDFDFLNEGEFPDDKVQIGIEGYPGYILVLESFKKAYITNNQKIVSMHVLDEKEIESLIQGEGINVSLEDDGEIELKWTGFLLSKANNIHDIWRLSNASHVYLEDKISGKADIYGIHSCNRQAHVEVDGKLIYMDDELMERFNVYRFSLPEEFLDDFELSKAHSFEVQLFDGNAVNAIDQSNREYAANQFKDFSLVDREHNGFSIDLNSPNFNGVDTLDEIKELFESLQGYPILDDNLYSNACCELHNKELEERVYNVLENNYDFTKISEILNSSSDKKFKEKLYDFEIQVEFYFDRDDLDADNLLDEDVENITIDIESQLIMKTIDLIGYGDYKDDVKKELFANILEDMECYSDYFLGVVSHLISELNKRSEWTYLRVMNDFLDEYDYLDSLAESHSDKADLLEMSARMEADSELRSNSLSFM